MSLKTNPLQREDLAEFRNSVPSRCARETSEERVCSPLERWRPFEVDVILKTEDVSLDLSWDGYESVDARSVVDLDEMSRLIAEDLRRALAIVTDVESDETVTPWCWLH